MLVNYKPSLLKCSERFRQIVVFEANNRGTTFAHNYQRRSEGERMRASAADEHKDRAASAAPPPPQKVKLLHPLTSAAVVCRYGAPPQFGALPHVVQWISEFIDYACPPYWTIAQACEKNRLVLLKRLAARELCAGVDKYYKAFQFSSGLVSAVQHDNLEMAQWLCQVYCPTMGFATKAMIEAVKTGNLRIAEWLAEHREDIIYSSSMVDEAASRGQLEILKWLHSHPRNRGCVNNRSWEALCNAVYAGHLEVAQFLLRHEYILSISHSRDYTEWCGGFDMIKWLHESPLLGWVDDALRQVVEQGKLDIVRWIYDNCTEGLANGGIPPNDNDENEWNRWTIHGNYTYPMDIAATEGHLDIVKWLYKNRSEGYSDTAVVGAAMNGHLDILKWLHALPSSIESKMAMQQAAANGHLHVVKWLHEHCPGQNSATAMNFAAGRGHLNIVKWLHENGGGCTPAAMDGAARSGHLNIVKWLHENRQEGCTTNAMDYAAGNGHLGITEWLDSNRDECCTTQAMDNAAANGHLHVVKWLHEHRKEGCTSYAMDNAALKGHLDVVKWLHENRTEGCTTCAMDHAKSIEITRFLHENRLEGCTADAIDCAVDVGDFDRVLYLHNHRSEGCSSRAAFYALNRNDFEVFLWLNENYPDQVDLVEIRRMYGIAETLLTAG